MLYVYKFLPISHKRNKEDIHPFIHDMHNADGRQKIREAEAMLHELGLHPCPVQTYDWWASPAPLLGSILPRLHIVLRTSVI